MKVAITITTETEISAEEASIRFESGALDATPGACCGSHPQHA